MRGRIGTTDAGGELGRRVVERLARAGAPQTAVVLGESTAPDVPGTGVAAVRGYDDPDALRDALAGVGTLLLVPMREHPERARLQREAVDAAVAAGVQRIATGELDVLTDTVSRVAGHPPVSLAPFLRAYPERHGHLRSG